MNMNMNRFRSERRGIVLLVVLSLLALFTILAVSFLLVSGQYKSAATVNVRTRRAVTSPEKVAHQTVLQLLRDTRSNSVIRGHSLLRDLYGSDGVRGQIDSRGAPAAQGVAGNELTQLEVRGVPLASQPFSLTLASVPDYYCGRVMTMLDGPAANLSSRIVDYTPTAPGPDGTWGTLDDFITIRCESFRGPKSQLILPNANDAFLINGHPFNGTGHGYDSSTGNIDATSVFPGPDLAWGVAGMDDDGANGMDDIGEAGWGGSDDFTGTNLLSALLPNPLAHQPLAATLPTNSDTINIGGADESWDTFDYQNMFLAMVPPDLDRVPEIVPSFHRPALVNYWFQYARSNLGLNSMNPRDAWRAFSMPYGADRVFQMTGGDDPAIPAQSRHQIVALLRACTMRPLPEDHPEFQWNNNTVYDLTQNQNNAQNRAGFHLLGNQFNGRWDVDNDGDGIPDSIWIDVGLPVQTAPDGRRFRPLVAILCQDLDGRLNLNAHGVDPTVASAVTFNVQLDASSNIVGGRFDVPQVTGTYSGNGTPRLPRGLGMGPADVSLAPVFWETAVEDARRQAQGIATRNEALQLLLGRYASATTGVRSPGQEGMNDLLSVLSDQPLPDNYAGGLTSPSARSSYGSPPDLYGVLAMGIDHYGQPLTRNVFGANATVDDPYEMFLGNQMGDVLSSTDTPYDAAELERLLRYYDIDASRLPDRLVRLGQETFSYAANRRRVTTLSSHVPVVSSVAYPEDRNGTSMRARTLLDLYVETITAELTASGATPAQVAMQLPGILETIVPFEIRHGERFDLNRPFGNGRDDNGNGVVDEPSETGTQAWPGYSAVPFSQNNDDPLMQGNPRTMYARHLYCLMLLLSKTNGNLPPRPGEAPGTTPELLQRIAQWAVNVVDFRDPDAIMTAFEYDRNPFDGWNVDGNLATNEGVMVRGVAWGCEAPDLLITETVAFHDRRVKDTLWDPTEERRDASNPTKRDDDLDQYRIPEGSLFVELHCPRTDNVLMPRELYSRVAGQEWLDLGKLAPNGAPVWRLAIGTASAPAIEKPWSPGNNPMPSSETFEPTGIERIVWFSTVAPPAGHPDRSKIFYGRTANPRVEPNGFTVVGPRAATHLGSKEGGDDGDPMTHDWEASEHRLVMGAAFQAYNTANVLVTPGNIRTPLTVICAADPPPSWAAGGPITQIGMNISEPLPLSGNYYPQPNPAGTMFPDDPIDAYDDSSNPMPLFPDQPFDERPGMPLESFTETGSPAGMRRSCYLQRLADPTRPWDVTTNPYMTVDFSTIDLTVFSGEEDTNRMTPDNAEWIDPSDEDPLGTAPDEKFVSRQRDGSVGSYAGAATFSPSTITRSDSLNFADDGFRRGHVVMVRGTSSNNGLYRIESVNNSTLSISMDTPLPAAESAPRARVYAFTGNRYSPSTTEPAEGPPSQNPDYYWPYELRHTLGYLNEATGSPTVPAAGYAGAPPLPYPWLTWNDRPFASAYEILNVPASAPSRLGYEFSAWSITNRFYDPLPDNRKDSYAGTSSDFAGFYGSHSHLLNFLITDGGANPNAFHRLLDCVDTPSRFVGTQRWYNPTTFSVNAAAATFRPPFNHLSRFREPGRVNINTLLPDSSSQSRIWEGIAKLFPELDATQHVTSPLHPGPDRGWGDVGIDDDGNGMIDDLAEAGWPGSDDFTRVLFERLLLSRRGYSDRGGDFLTMNGAYPSRFSNPFRASAHADLMPNTTGLRLTSGVQATLLRSDPFPHFDPGENGVWGDIGDDNMDMVVDDPLEAGQGDDVLRVEPLLVPDASVYTQVNANFRSQDRNPYFRNQALQHLGNMFSTNSNVYAVWITVGFFEANDNPGGPDLVHPDGLRLGMEMGLDSGEVKRHRFFYIIDRSTPVAFNPGVNHNVENAILLQRKIEE